MSPRAANDNDSPDAQSRSVPVHAFEHGRLIDRDDQVAVERALEIHVAGAQPLITMRTPGDDLALAAGLLHGEGVIADRSDIVYLRHAANQPDVVRLMLRPDARTRLDRMERSTVMTSACGVCGKPSFQPPRAARGDAAESEPVVSPQLLLTLPDKLRPSQGVFSSTGGLHAAGLFDARGGLIDICEDVGRHNALDKLIGRTLRAGHLPLTNRILLLSGRASYELLQKSVMAGLPFVCAISAPSSYAINLAREHDVSLVGFLRNDRFNVYAGARRIAVEQSRPERGATHMAD